MTAVRSVVAADGRGRFRFYWHEDHARGRMCWEMFDTYDDAYGAAVRYVSRRGGGRFVSERRNGVVIVSAVQA